MDRIQSALTPSLANVVGSKLWQFQVRKENKALLEQLQENEKRRQYDAAEAEKKLKESADRIIALESRISEIEREKTKDDQARKEFMKGDAVFKSDFKNFLEGRISKVDLLAIMKGPSLVVSETAPSLRDSGQSSNVPSLGAASPHQFKPTTATKLPSSDQEITDANNKSKDRIQKVSRFRSKPTIARRPVTRSRNRAAETIVEPAITRPASPKVPRFAQGTNHMNAYYNNANGIFKSLNMTDPQMEVDFISAFLKGITDSKMSNKLITELQQLHPSRIRKDGRIEVLCDWEDIPEGLRSAGMLSPAKEHSRRKHRILGDLSDLGFQVEMEQMD